MGDKILICYNYNLNGSKKYRGCITAFLSIACGYNGSKVVVRPKLDVLASYTDSNFDTTNQLTTLLQGAVSELEAVEFETNPHVFLNLNYKTGAAVSDINIKVVEEL